MMINKSGVFIFLGITGLMACQQKETVPSEGTVTVTPVQVTYVSSDTVSDEVELTAVSSYLQKSYVKANINGYVQSSNAVVGQQVARQTVLFTLITKEAKAIGNEVNHLDPAFKFSGISKIRSDQSGFIATVSHQTGDYVQDGEAMAVISNQESLVFLLDLPYELRTVATQNQGIELTLPDGEKLKGKITGSMPAVDSSAQTQRFIIRVNPSHSIPEGLIAKVKVSRKIIPHAQTLPKSALLSNETEDEFWVMKMINDSTAVKVPVKPGIEKNQSVEIISPVFSEKDRIITVGNYGIADTAKVKIQK